MGFYKKFLKGAENILGAQGKVSGDG